MFSIIMVKKVVTNLRIDQDEWLQLKTMAGELGMSVNEYIIQLVKTVSTKIELALDKNESNQESLSVWNLPNLSKIKDKPMGLSKEDKLIYGL